MKQKIMKFILKALAIGFVVYAEVEIIAGIISKL